MKGTVTVLAAAAVAPASAPAAAPGAALPPAAAKPVAQQQMPTPTPFRFIPSGATTTTTTTTPAPRAGGVPIELVLPLLAGGASALSGGVYLLPRARRPEDSASPVPALRIATPPTSRPGPQRLP